MKIGIELLSAAFLIYPGFLFALDGNSVLKDAAQTSGLAETSPDSESARTFAASALEGASLSAPAPVSAGAAPGNGAATVLAAPTKVKAHALGSGKVSRMSNSSEPNEYGLAGKIWGKLGDGFNFLFGKPKPERVRGVELIQKNPDLYLYGAGVSAFGLGMGVAILAAGVTGFGAVIGAGLAGIGLIAAGAMLWDFCFGVERN